MPLVRKPTQPAEPPKASAGEVLAGLASANPEARWTAARAAAELADSAGALAAALPQETDARVREAMFTSLARIGTRESLRAMLPMLRSNDAALRTGALDALCSSHFAAHELLPQLLSDPDVDVRILSCELARSLPSEDASRSLCTLLDREAEVNVCAAAIEVLAEVGNQAALPALERCAQRFPQVPFLTFAIRLATDRIRAAGSRD
ncbi:MAG TPA: HEAT repeat domain-containing protein [Steroidobacteraceae bacterium]|nr:HEAT repeat domain-containing protein [Steroidobacteraceae bacterium]